MKLSSQFAVASPPEHVFPLFLDADVMRECLPGCEELVRVDDATFRGRLVSNVAHVRFNWIDLVVNGDHHDLDVADDALLLDVLRERAGTTSVREGCGVGACGAMQCGYCIPGFVMMTHELLAENRSPSRDDVVEHLEGNTCRCGTYEEICQGALAAAGRRNAR